MLFGPFPPFFIERLRSALGDFAPEAKVYSSHEAAASLREKVRERATAPSPYPTFEGQENLLHIDIPFDRLLMVKGELEKMGVSLTEKDYDPEFSRGEYLCPKCGFVSATAELCPKHRIRLLEFSAWVADRARRSEQRTRTVTRLMLAVALSVLIYVTLHRFLHPSHLVDLPFLPNFGGWH